MYTVLKIRGDNCSGCNVMKPIFDDLKANNKREDVDFQELKADDNMDLMELWKIRSLPTIIVWKGNEEMGKKSGVIMPIELKDWIYSITN